MTWLKSALPQWNGRGFSGIDRRKGEIPRRRAYLAHVAPAAPTATHVATRRAGTPKAKISRRDAVRADRHRLLAGRNSSFAATRRGGPLGLAFEGKATRSVRNLRRSERGASRNRGKYVRSGRRRPSCGRCCTERTGLAGWSLVGRSSPSFERGTT